MTVNTIDTGERKEMFGFTARHLKRTMTSQTSPDACSQNQMRIDTDGWYINLEYGLNCGGSERPPQTGRTASRRMSRSLSVQAHRPDQARLSADRNHDDVWRCGWQCHVHQDDGSDRVVAAAARRGIVRRAGGLHRGEESTGNVGHAFDGRCHGDVPATESQTREVDSPRRSARRRTQTPPPEFASA